MEMRKVLLACAVLCSIASIACAGSFFDKFHQVLKACNDSELPIDDISEINIYNGRYSPALEMYRIHDNEYFYIEWFFKAPTDIVRPIKRTETRWELNCDSGEIKGIGKLDMIAKGLASQCNDEDTSKLTKGETYILIFKGNYDKKPTAGDKCVSKLYLTINDEEKSYCTIEKAEIYKTPQHY